MGSLKKITEWEEVKNIWKMAAKDHIYDIYDYKEGYCRYFGCGNHIYILLKGIYHKISVEEIGKMQVNPRIMAAALEECAEDFRIVVVDFEMGGMSVYGGAWGRGKFCSEMRIIKKSKE